MILSMGCWVSGDVAKADRIDETVASGREVLDRHAIYDGDQRHELSMSEADQMIMDCAS